MFEPHPFDFENEGICEKELSSMNSPSFVFTNSNVNQHFTQDWEEKLNLPSQTSADDGILTITIRAFDRGFNEN